jgi:hypothetical protein
LSVATLSYWQSGRSRPERSASLSALGALEEILAVKRGELARRLPPRRRAMVAHDADGAGRNGALVYADSQLLDRLVEEVGLSWDAGIERISVHDRMRLRADRTEDFHAVREIIRATRDGVDRYPMWYGGDALPRPPELAAVTNCRIGRVARAPDRSYIVAEVLLERPLRQGESVLVEHEVVSSEHTEPLTRWTRGTSRKAREIHLEVRFHDEDIPLSAEKLVITDGVEKLEPVVLTGPTLHLLTLDFGPGICGLRWSW